MAHWPLLPTIASESCGQREDLYRSFLSGLGNIHVHKTQLGLGSFTRFSGRMEQLPVDYPGPAMSAIDLRSTAY